MLSQRVHGPPRSLGSAITVLANPTGTFELGGPDVVSWQALHERIRRVLGKRRLAVPVPPGLVRAGAKLGRAVPAVRGAPYAVAMLEFDDNVVSHEGAPETFGLEPISLDEQLRRAVE